MVKLQDDYKIIEFGQSDEVVIVIPCSIDKMYNATRLAMICMQRAT